jgi:hypothetical protein
MFDSAPQAKAKFDAALSDAEREAKDGYAAAVLKDARTDLRKLGITGVRIQQAIDAAPTLQDKATTAIRALNSLDPASEAVRGVTGEQGNVMGQAASGAAMNAPRTARQALAGFQPQDPQQAAVRAITEFQPGAGSFKDRWRRRLEFWVPLAAAGTVIGRPSTYAMAGIAMGAPIGARELLAYTYRQSLRSPEAANAFLYALKNPGTQQGLKTLARLAAQAAIFKDAQAPAGGILGRGTTAMVEPFFPSAPVKPEALAEMHRKLAAGGTPDITRGVRGGHIRARDLHAELADARRRRDAMHWTFTHPPERLLPPR